MRVGGVDEEPRTDRAIAGIGRTRAPLSHHDGAHMHEVSAAGRIWLTHLVAVLRLCIAFSGGVEAFARRETKLSERQICSR